MMNDFEFIKDKVENSGVNAPEDMGEAYVERLIADSQPQPVQVRRRRPSARRAAALAASFALVAGVASGLAVHLSRAPGEVRLPEVDEGTGLIRFSDYDQVREALKRISDRNTVLYGAALDEEADFYEVAKNSSATAAAAASPEAVTDDTITTGSASGDLSHSETYRQVEGVDEADIIKTDGRYIYCVTNSFDYNDYSALSYVSVFPAVPGTRTPTAKIFPGESYASTPDEASPDEETDVADIFDYSYYLREYNGIHEIFLRDGRMVVIAGSGADDEKGVYRIVTTAYVYDVTDPERAALLDSFTQSGSYNSSRMIGDELYIITTEYNASDIPVCGRGSTPGEIAADCIYSVEDPYTGTFLVVSAYDTLDYTSATQSKAVLGVAEEIYCNEDNLYITATEYKYYYGVYSEAAVDYAADEDSVVTFGADDSAQDDEPSNKTKIFKVSLTDGIAFTAYGEVDGYIDSRYSLDEYKGNLRVATTVTDKDFNEKNNLYILNGDLDQVGAVTGFAETESIKAVRYVGDTAYVITYERTDPLFVIDLSSPTSPEILGSVKISGFSTMLVPIDRNTILGLGYNASEVDYTDMEVTDGFKLALFDVSDPSAPKVLDTRSYVNYNSAVMYDPRALVYNPDRGDFLVPMNYYYYDDSSDYKDYYDEWNDDDWESFYNAHVEQYGGALNFRVESGRIVETGLYRSSADTVERCVYAGDTIYMTYVNNSNEVFLDSVSYE